MLPLPAVNVNNSPLVVVNAAFHDNRLSHQPPHDFGIVADLAQVPRVGIAGAGDAAVPAFEHFLWCLNVARVEVH
jgi:hypothetical protein